jgi:hypothetical protein
MLTIAYFMHILTFYFILKWVPKVVSDMGFTPRRRAACWSGPMSAG